MAELRIPQEAEDDLDEHWLYVARESGSIDLANRLVNAITRRFWLLGVQHYMGRNRADDLTAGWRSFSVDFN